MMADSGGMSVKGGFRPSFRVTDAGQQIHATTHSCFASFASLGLGPLRPCGWITRPISSFRLSIEFRHSSKTWAGELEVNAAARTYGGGDTKVVITYHAFIIQRQQPFETREQQIATL
jgi:hypothetical protein